MAEANEQITVTIGKEQKKEMLELAHRTGISITSRVRSLIYALLEEHKKAE